MKQLVRILLVLLGALCVTACPMDIEKSLYINIECNSPHSIGYLFSDENNIERVIPEFDRPPEILGIGESESNYMTRYSDGWAEFVTRFPNDTFSVFIFHADTLNIYSWDQIREEFKVLVRYDISAEDYYKFPGTDNNEMDITIPYPPTESMKTVHMLPSYQEVMEQYLIDCEKIAGRNN
ncbi:MAG: hypothetical protein IKP46_02690 [Bacteroidales bacterium]|nr:hypothetical protein [Bacteroidales bacterium]